MKLPYKIKILVLLVCFAVAIFLLNVILFFTTKSLIDPQMGSASLLSKILIFGFLPAFVLFFVFYLLLDRIFKSSLTKLYEASERLEKETTNNELKIKGNDPENIAEILNALIDQFLSRDKKIVKEEKKLETLLETLNEAIVALDSEKKILVFNKAAQTMTGTTDESALGKHIDDVLNLFGGDEKIKLSDYFERMDELETIHREKGLKIKSGDGKLFHVAFSISQATFKDEQIRGWVITIIDESKSRAFEEMKLDFVSMAAHELRTPLTVIRGYAELLNSEIGDKLNPEHKEHLHRLEYNATNLGTLIDNLLNVSRIERGSYQINPAPVDMTSLVKNAVIDLSDQANSKGQNLTFVEPLEKMPPVMADQTRINQVLTNLINNAITYTPVGESITVTIEKKEGFLNTSVKDTGVGIPKEAIPKLFTKFFRVNSVLEQGSKGTGLGLFISKSIINMHGGEIYVESELGKGSTFTFTLPLSKEDQIPKMSQMASKGGPAIVLNPEKFAQRTVN